MTRFEKTLIILCLLSGLFLGRQFLEIGTISYESHQSTDTKSLGVVTRVLNDTRHKQPKEITWNNLNKQKSVSPGEMIFSGNKSEISILFTDGSEVTLKENSIVSLSLGTKGININLQRGFLKAELKGPTQITANKKVIKKSSQGKSATIELSSFSKASLNINNGSVEVSDQKVDQRIKPMLAELNEDQEFLSEEINVNVVKIDKKQVIKANENEIVTFELSEDSVFKKVIQNFESEKSFEDFLKQTKLSGVYYYRTLKNNEELSRSTINLNPNARRVAEFNQANFDFEFAKSQSQKYTCRIQRATNKPSTIKLFNESDLIYESKSIDQILDIPCSKGAYRLELIEEASENEHVTQLTISELILPSKVTVQFENNVTKLKELETISYKIINYKEFSSVTIEVLHLNKLINTIELTDFETQHEFQPSDFGTYQFMIKGVDQQGRYRQGVKQDLTLVKTYEYTKPKLKTKSRIVL
jgi:hypothetical protein